MVMHARKSHRINDGYFEKHQTHPYQNAKYNSSSKGNYSERFSHEHHNRMRDSPNGNNSYSPDSQSPRDTHRTFKPNSSSSYVHKDKERENNRLRDKYSSDCVSTSPKYQRRRDNTVEHRINQERDNAETLVIHPKLVSSSQNSRDRDIQQRSNKPLNTSSLCSDKQRSGGEERVTRVGDWSEHISSSGKKYYYNCKTEISQWEKPREWIIRTQQQQGSTSHHHHPTYNTPNKNTNVHPHEKHSTPSSVSSLSSSSSSASSRLLPRPDLIKHPNRTGNDSLNMTGLRTYWNNTPGSSHHPNTTTGPNINITTAPLENEKTDDMDICSTSSSTPTSEMNYLSTSTTTVSSSVSGVTSGCCNTTNHCETNINNSTTSVSRLAAVSQIKLVDNQSSSSIPLSLPTIPSSQQPPPSSIPVLQPSSTLLSPPVSTPLSKPNSNNIIVVSSTPNSLIGGDISTSVTSCVVGSSLAPLKVETNMTCDPGPPTPTHSETTTQQQPSPMIHSTVDIRKQNTSPIVSTTPTLTTASSSLSSLTSSVIHAMRPQAPTVNPALANHYREDLTSHVRGWPADACEKQAQKMSEESNHNSMHLCRASAELKSARAIVRNCEIQANIQEQRIIYLRQQIQRLEEMKSQNSYMSAADEAVPANQTSSPAGVNRIVKK